MLGWFDSWVWADASEADLQGFERYAREASAHNLTPQMLAIAVLAAVTAPTDYFFFDTRTALGMIVWRIFVAGVSLGGLALGRTEWGHERSREMLAGVMLFGAAGSGFLLGRLGDLHSPFFAGGFFTPFATVIFLYPPAERIGITAGMVALFTAFFVIANGGIGDYAFIGPASVLLMFGVVASTILGHAIYRTSLDAYRHRARLAETAAELDAAKAQSERLLLNILPGSVATRLKEHDRAIAQGYDDVSVLFADLCDFTRWSGGRTPDEVVAMLDRLFSEFDEVVGQLGLEKIKTIGDAYMVAGNLPDRTPDHLERMAELAMELRDRASALGEEIGHPIQLRIGLHVGPVVAGVIGRKKFIYDLWGDTVNIASRMESHGLPGKIQVTDAVRERIADWYVIEERGDIEIKGKGTLHTWWITGRTKMPLWRSGRTPVPQAKRA